MHFLSLSPSPHRVFIGLVVSLSAVAFFGCAKSEAGKTSLRSDPTPGALSATATVPEPRQNPPGPIQFPKGQWTNLFDGQTLNGWAITDFAGHGDVLIDGEKLILERGIMTGITWTNELPKMNYEVALEAMRVVGSDFFCGLTFPVGDDPCSLIVGGWGGGVVGLSSLDGEDAANNDTTQYLNFETGRWYAIRLRVEPSRIQAWIDDDKVVDVDTTRRKVSIRPEVDESRPFGIASWSTTAALRNLRMRTF